jgi:hypothetical protein
MTAEPEGPKFKTVIVTRGMQPQQSYQVVQPEKPRTDGKVLN